MNTCLQCGEPVPESPTRPRRFCTGWHSKLWRRRNPGQPLPPREAGGGAKWDALRDWPARRSELGPEAPLLGLTEDEAWRRRRERLLQAIRDGVEMEGLQELSGLTRAAVYQAASRAGLRIARTHMPFGVPS